MSPAFIRGVADHLPRARITFDKFHVVAHPSVALDQTRRLEQRRDPGLKGLRWTLLKDRQRLSAEARADLDALISQAATKRTARAWLYREGLRAILDRKQINVVAAAIIGMVTLRVLRNEVSILPAERVPVIRNELRDPGRLAARELTNGVACLADDPPRRHRHCEHGDVTTEVRIVAQLRIDTSNEVRKLDRLIGDWPLQVLTDHDCDLFDRERCDIGDVNRLTRFEFAKEGAVRCDSHVPTADPGHSGLAAAERKI